MGLSFDNDHKIIGDTTVPELCNAAAIGLIDVEAIEIATQLYG